MIVNGGGRIRQRRREKAEDFAGEERVEARFHHGDTEEIRGSGKWQSANLKT